MDQLLEQLLSTDILTDEVKTNLKEAFNTEIEKAKEEARQEAREEAIAEAKVEFATKFTEDKAALVEALDTKITALFAEELRELKEDIEHFRDLEAEYATKLVEEKEKLGLQVKADMAELVEALDVFIEGALNEEIEELKESIEEVRKIEFAKALYESYETAFRTKFFNDTGINKKLEESVTALEAKNKKLAETEEQLAKLVREKEMAKVLDQLHGRPREIMEAILNSVPTDKLEEGYNNFIGRVLHESATVVENKSEKEPSSESVLAESESTNNATVVTDKSVIITGDSTIVENVEIPSTSNLSESEKARLKRIAGIGR